MCGNDQAEHDKSLKKFLKVAEDHSLIFNESKCVYSSDTIDLFGYRIGNGTLRPDPNRVKTLLELPCPKTMKAQQRVVGFFAYYCTMDFTILGQN